jgi:hypothetical protein
VPTGISDGTGKGNLAKVDVINRLTVHSVSDDRYAALNTGKAWSFDFDAVDPAGADDYFVYIKNTSATETFLFTDLRVSSTVAGAVEVHKVTGTPTYVGETAMPQTSRNLASDNSAPMTANYDANITGLTSAGRIFHIKLEADKREKLSTSAGIVVPPSTASEYFQGGDLIMFIEDGTGKGYRSKVDKFNRVHTDTVQVTRNQDAVIKGLAFNINTGQITLTDAADTPVLYVKNNEDFDLFISHIAIGIGESDGTAALEYPVTVVRNPTLGTIITSTPTNVDINRNRNFGSNRTLTVDAYKGATGDTMTNGDDLALLFANQNARLFASIDLALPKGTSIGVKIDPGASNTSVAVYAALICYLDDETA